MRWQRQGRSRNLEDRRAAGRTSRRIPMGRMPRMPMPQSRGGKTSIGGLVLVLGIVWLMGGNPLEMLSGGGDVLGGAGSVGVNPNVGIDVASRGPATGTFRQEPGEEELVDFVSFVLDDLQRTWSQLMPEYRDAKLVLFRDATRSGCGVGQSEMGPFYCPADQKVYIDLAFYHELRARFGAPGDFAQAYVLAHEIGHHLQRLDGTEERVRRAQRSNPAAANQLSVAMELQADCLAGVWGYSTRTRGILEDGDIEEGLRAAAAIGDDRIQRMSGRGVHPESFTHGSSKQRTEWLQRGLRSGDPTSCDTFRS